MKNTQPVRVSRVAMATQFEIALFGAEPERLTAAGEGALDEIERIEQRLSLFASGSDISHVNALAASRPVRIDPRTFHLLQKAKILSEDTLGAFDITVTPLLRAWGFVGGWGKPCDPAEVDGARELVGMDHVILDEENFSVGLDREGVQIDLGAIGKGYAVEQAALFLQECGVTSALVHGGTSSIRAIGGPPESESWRVRVQDPADGQEYLADVRLKDGSLSVSSPHGKSFVHEGVLMGHVLDPRTGAPVQGARLAAVVCPSPTDGDALSTALLVLGEDGMNALAETHPEAELLLALSGPSGRVITSGDVWER